MNKLLSEQVIIIITLAIYLSGFMDISKNKFNDPLNNLEFKNLTESLHKNAPVKNTVIMIVDALRTDHLVNSNHNLMEFSKKLLKSRKGLGYMVHTETPTVTLPRIKSLLTGTIPGFMDVIFNFASKELTDENLVHFWKNSGRKVRFYGDDTWLGLFPDAFDQWKGVTSFYVSDYIQVDANVTEQLMTSLAHDTWDVMILHYLGLDHIGHLAGPASDLIPAKLKEMDSIVHHIYEELERKNETYLLLVCGDHGMSDGGGHGGASASEIMTSAMLVSNIFKQNIKVANGLVHQVDLASTLAILTGVPIPNKNIGTPLFPVLEFLPLHLKLQAEHQLTTQLVSNALSYLTHVDSEELKSGLQRISQMHNSLSRSCSDPSKCPHYEQEARRLSNSYANFQTRASNVLAENKHSHDMFLLTFSLSAIFIVSISTLLNEILMNFRDNEGSHISAFLILIFLSSFSIIYYLNRLIINAFILSTSFSFGVSRVRCSVAAVRPTTIMKPFGANFLQIFIFSFILLHPLSLLATSFVEEEHQTVYFILSSLHFLFMINFIKTLVNNSRTSAAKTHPDMLSSWYLRILSFIKRDFRDIFFLKNNTAPVALSFLSWLLFRHLRYYNTTGDKWRHLIYFNNIITDFPETIKFPLLLVAYILSIFLYSPFMTFTVIVSELLPYLPYNMQYVYKIVSHIVPYPVIIVIFMVNFATLIPRLRRMLSRRIQQAKGQNNTFSRFIFCFECFFALLFIVLQKRENYLCTLFSLMHFHILLRLLLKFDSTLGLPNAYVSVVVFWLADGHFFSQGNSNSLTTVRIAAGFVGVNYYSPVIHGLLIAVHTFGSKIIIYLHYIRLAATYKKDGAGCAQVLRCWWIMQLIVLNVYLLVVTIQRHHLFIWSVFAPKLLYEGCNVICLFIVTLLSLLASKATDNFEEKTIT